MGFGWRSVEGDWKTSRLYFCFVLMITAYLEVWFLELEQNEHFIYVFIYFWKYLFFFFFCLSHTAWGVLGPWPRIEPGPSAVRAQSPNHWNTREFNRMSSLAYWQRWKISRRETWVHLSSALTPRSRYLEEAEDRLGQTSQDHVRSGKLGRPRSMIAAKIHWGLTMCQAS